MIYLEGIEKIHSRCPKLNEIRKKELQYQLKDIGKEVEIKEDESELSFSKP